MYYIGVDLGGTSVKVGLLDKTYTIIDKVTAPTGKGLSSDEVLKTIATLCEKLIEKNGLTTKDVHSVGIGCPGIASPKDGMIYYSSNLSFKDVNVREGIQKYIPLDVFVENDANCAALGEVINGAAKGEEDVIVVTLGTGVGGGIVLSGKVFGGAFCGAGEVGHHIIEMDGIECGCGRKGCWEQYASATALIRDARQCALDNPETQMIALSKDGDINNINAKVVFDAAQNGDQFAQTVLDQYFKNVAHGITNLINIFQPGMVVIGGGMSAQKEKLTVPVTKYVEEQMYGGLKLKTRIEAAILGNDAGIIGAALIGTRI
ncbi:MAG: ROK family protein [Cellulosilyticaceae bacterium]